MTTLEEVFLRLGEKEEYYGNSSDEKSELDNNSQSILLDSSSARQLTISVEAGMKYGTKELKVATFKK